MKFKYVLFIYLFFNIITCFSQEKKVFNIEIKGAKKTKVSFLNKIIQTKVDKPLDTLLLNEDIKRLKKMPLVAHAYFQVFKSHDNFYNVFYNIEENFTLIPEVGFWTSTNNQFSYKLGAYDYNFLGRNIAFGGFYQNNGFDTFGINFIAPNLFSRDWGLSLNFQNWKSEEPLYFDNESANYLYNNISYEAIGLYQINEQNQVNFGVNFFKEKYQYLSGATNSNVPTFLNVNKQLFKLVYKYSNLNYHYQYVDGFKSEFYGQFVTSEDSSQKDFLIFWNDFFFFKRNNSKGNGKGNWANRLRVGLSSNDNTPFAPFSLDNNVNLRGVGILVDRGTGSIVLNSEYRYTLYDKKGIVVQSNLFVDSGTWRTPGGNLSDFVDKKNIKVFSGLGLRFISKKIYNATFRIDYGFKTYDFNKDTKGGLVFGIGQYF